MNVPINLFYHIALINHWQQIVTEQLQTIRQCGLYDECDDFHVGAVGDESEFEKLKVVFAENGIENKVHFNHHPDIKQYEFFTLKILKNVCDWEEKFYGFYIHVKGCSYSPPMPESRGGDFWRRYMMDWIIKKWRENYRVLDLKYMGYDLVGVKVVPARVSPSNRTHISGNFFAFNSEYVKSLPPIEKLDMTNRFESEMYISSGQPIIYMPCNLFVDYFNRADYDTFMNDFKELKDYCL